MARLSKDRSTLMDKLVSDCITFGLKVDESLEYIKRELEPISRRTYFRRREKLSSEESHMIWLSYFTRIGFVQLHREQMDILQAIQDHSIKRLHEEIQKKNPNDNFLLRLKNDIRANSSLLSEFSLGTPVIAGLKAKLERSQNGEFANIHRYYRDSLSS